VTDLSTAKELPDRASDATLLAAACVGDDEAFRALFDRHVDAIHAYAAARVGPDDADDVVVETFAVAWRRRRDFRGDADSARPWLYGIASTLVRSRRSAEQRWQQLQLRVASQSTHHDQEPALPISADLRAAIAGLSHGEREVLLLVALGDLTIAAAAHALGIRSVTARMRLLRARRSVASHLQRNEDER
jgi:RNA polymerase sigma-70 factor (ECF subfamily)